VEPRLKVGMKAGGEANTEGGKERDDEEEVHLDSFDDGSCIRLNR
jgi:hypothetical protein